MSSFAAQYAVLEERFRQQAESDGDVFLPNAPPAGPVDYVLIASEPSLKRWAQSPQEAEDKISRGFRNFLFYIEVFIVHFCVREYLCSPGQTYHITDLSKGAMTVSTANRDRWERFDRWYPLLLDELRLVAKPDAKVLAIGGAVESYLLERRFEGLTGRLMHYSGQAVRHHMRYAQAREAEFKVLAEALTLDRIVETAKTVMAEAGSPAEFVEEALSRLSKPELTPSQKCLIFVYWDTMRKVAASDTCRT